MDEFDFYELAYLCGGPVRVVETALVALYERGDVRISRATRRANVVARDPGDPVEEAVLREIPAAGRRLGQVIAAAAAAPEPDAVADRLVGAKLLRPGKGRATRGGRMIRRRIARAAKDEPSALHRFAVLGPAAIEDARLREILESDDPKPFAPPRKRFRDHSEGSGLSDTRYDAGGSGDGGY